MVNAFLVIFITLTIITKVSSGCDNFASITVKENIPYPSAYLLDVSSRLQADNLISPKDKDNIYLSDITGSKPFSLNNGKLLVSGQLDREQICNIGRPNQRLSLQHCCISVCCMYIGISTGQGKNVYIKVIIEDENDNEPVFPQQSIKLQLHENTELGHNIVLPKAEDLDSSNFGIDRYDIIQDKNCLECFQVKSETRDGGVALVIKSKIDRELYSVFNLQILAIDKGTSPKTGTLSVAIEVIDINDNSPQFEETSFVLSEEENGRSGREIRSIKVTDADIGINSQISYAIEDYTSVSQRYFRLFSVRNGVSLLLQSTLDYELINSFRFKIVARDHGTPSLSSTATISILVINVNDEPPEISFYQRGLSLDPNNILLQLPENGLKEQSIIFVHVTDKDSKLSDINCEVFYPKDVFYLSEIQHTNIVEKKKLFDLQNLVVFDREITNSYRIRIICSDSNTMVKLTQSVEIQLRVTDINDNAPVFSSSFYYGKIIETNSLDKVVDIKDGVIKVTDADVDANSRIKFMLSNIGNSTDSEKFSITTHYAQIKNVVPIDFEERKQYIFLIIAQDSGIPSLSSSATITVNVLDANDNRPEISQKFYLFSFLEEQPIGTEVGKIEATDADSDVNNKDFIYEIVNHDGSRSNSRPNKLFLIENNTGSIKTRVILDHEKDQHVNFLVRVRNTNEDSLSRDKSDWFGSSVSVNIKIIDINDNSPKLILKDNQNQDQAHVNDILKRPVIFINNELQTTSNQCSLFPYTFSDADEGINAEVRVSLKDNPHFQLDMGHNLICPKTLNIAPGPYTVYIIGEDKNGGNGSKRSEFPINIVVKSSNPNKQPQQKKYPQQESEEKLTDYKAIIIFIVLIATIILFCFLLMIVVVKTKLCIPRNMAQPSRSREKVRDKQNNSESNKNYNLVIPGGICENKRLCNEYIKSNFNNQDAINCDYSNNLFFSRTVSTSMDIGNSHYLNEATMANPSQSAEFFFTEHGDNTLLPVSVDPNQNNELKYEQLQRGTGIRQQGNTLNWETNKGHQYNYLLEPRDSSSLSNNCDKTTPPKQDLLAVAGGYQKSINDVYLQTSFV